MILYVAFDNEINEYYYLLMLSKYKNTKSVMHRTPDAQIPLLE